MLLQEDYFREMSDRQKGDSLELLTPREREILQLAAEGRSNKEIAGLLNLSFYTVETHRSHVLQKLNLHTVPELILYAVRKGIIH
jgi:DNA-binding NarL/FixJ family response regulator